jgi:hypothetical protein
MTFIDLREMMLTAGLRSSQGTDISTLQLFETTHRVHLPKQVEENYQVMNGMEPLSAGPLPLACMRFWPIQAWCRAHAMFSEYEEVAALPYDFFICADYAAESLWFGMDLTVGSLKYGTVQGILGLHKGSVASTFSEFIAAIKAGADFVSSYFQDK